MTGRPRIFKTAAQLQKAIDAYFADCEGHLLKDGDNPVFDKNGDPVMVGQHPPTVTGLALAIGLASRQALLNYQGREEFYDAITRAKLRIEQYTEERLFDRDGVQGAKFSLSNNFSGWSDHTEVNFTGEPIKIIDDIPRTGGADDG